MNSPEELLINNENLYTTVSTFLNRYSTTGLEQALQHYTDLQQEYICKTKTYL